MSGIHTTNEKVHDITTPQGIKSTTEKIEHVDGQRNFGDMIPHSHHDHIHEHTHGVKTDVKPTTTLVDTVSYVAPDAKTAALTSPVAPNLKVDAKLPAVVDATHHEVASKTEIKPDATKIETTKTDTTKIDTPKTDATKADAKITAKDIVEKVKDVTGLNK